MITPGQLGYALVYFLIGFACANVRLDDPDTQISDYIFVVIGWPLELLIAFVQWVLCKTSPDC
jgi:hypothetical protein